MVGLGLGEYLDLGFRSFKEMIRVQRMTRVYRESEIFDLGCKRDEKKLDWIYLLDSNNSMFSAC